MSPSLPAASGRDVLRALQRAGFEVRSVQGSHHVLVYPDTRTRIVVPVRVERDLPRGTIRGVIRQAGLSVDEFCELLR